ncbi:MAG: DUF1572 domain-containing protein [Chitinophagaceae bacterium]|nr:DUF1572 domain-containing protein [Chitinophagaceae bacterium]
MTLTQNIAKHFREVHFGGNWTSSNLRDQLADVTWVQATTQVSTLNTIATLVYHSNYYVGVVLKVLRGGPLVGKDSDSFAHPPINSQDDWEGFLARVWREAEEFAQQVEKLPESRLWEDFTDSKYGNYYRNLHGIIEHMHYHLGQIVLVKKMI